MNLRTIASLFFSAAALLTLAPAASAADKKEEKSEHGKHHAKFPMPAAEFKKHSDERLAKWAGKLEEHIKRKNMPEAEAKAARARFAELSAKVNAAVTKAGADGTVTHEEAKEVREVAKEARHAARKHHNKK
jgi:hypothetical protein